jgi:hypothetical protein
MVAEGGHFPPHPKTGLKSFHDQPFFVRGKPLEEF